MKKIIIAIIVCVLLSVVLVSCGTDENVDRLHYRIEIDDSSFTEERLVEELSDSANDRYSFNETSAAMEYVRSYLYVDSETKRGTFIYAYDSVEKAKESYTDDMETLFCHVGYSIGYSIRINHLIIYGRDSHFLEVLSSLGVQTPSVEEIPYGMKLSRVDSSLSIQEVTDYLESIGAMKLYENERLITTDWYLPQEEKSGKVFLVWSDYKAEFEQEVPMYSSQEEFLLYVKETYFENAFEAGIQGYYTDDYMVLCYDHDWLTILDEAEAYYAETE